MRRAWIRLPAGVACALLPVAAPHAQPYPSKPVRVIVAYAAGGGTDIVARVIAQRLADSLGRPVVVDNRPGAAGNLATELAVKAPPDGYTVLVGNSGPMTVNPHLYRLAFDPARDLLPVTLIASAPLLVVVHPALPVRTLRDLVALARREPGRLSYSSAGVGSTNHLAGALFGLQAGVDVVQIPYKGAALAVTDLVGGQVPLSFQTLPSVGASVRAGRLRALAVASPRRAALFPEVPTSAEAGLAGYEVSAWYGLLVPAGTPRAVVERLHADTATALRAAPVVERLAAEGAEPAGIAPEAFGAFLAAETARWGRVVKASGMKAE